MRLINKIWKKFILKQYQYWFEDENLEQREYIQQLEDTIKEMLDKSLNRIPKTKGHITYNETLSILKKHCSLNNIYLSDPTYAVTTMTNAKEFSKESLIQTREYKKNTHDCENFSYALNGYWSDSLKSFCFGIAWSRTHAFNIMIDYKGAVWICEPQTNVWKRIEKLKSNKKYYPFRMVLI